MIRKCDCKHKFQDEKYGKGMRVHNERAGKDGGYIMDTAVMLDEAKPENLKAMIEFTKEYGVYR